MGRYIALRLNQTRAGKLAIDGILQLVQRKVDVSCDMPWSICTVQDLDGALEPPQRL
jgi:hypothetical protein